MDWRINFMFHVNDGLFFGRKENGDVRIVKTQDGKIDSPIIFDIIVDKSGWQSAISSVSAGGEDGYRYYLADIFHNTPKEKFLSDVKKWSETYRIKE